jgi:hypothetical protein
MTAVAPRNRGYNSLLVNGCLIALHDQQCATAFDNYTHMLSFMVLPELAGWRPHRVSVCLDSSRQEHTP